MLCHEIMNCGWTLMGWSMRHEFADPHESKLETFSVVSLFSYCLLTPRHSSRRR